MQLYSWLVVGLGVKLDWLRATARTLSLKAILPRNGSFQFSNLKAFTSRTVLQKYTLLRLSLVTAVLGDQEYYFHLRDEETEITVKARIFSKVTQGGWWS